MKILLLTMPILLLAGCQSVEVIGQTNNVETDSIAGFRDNIVEYIPRKMQGG